MSEYKRGFSLGFLLLKIGLGIFFIISGILILQGSASEPCIIAIRSIVKARIADTLCVVMGIVELAVGVMLLLSVFVCFGKTLNALFMPIIMIVWIMAIALIDVFGSAGLQWFWRKLYELCFKSFFSLDYTWFDYFAEIVFLKANDLS